MSARLVILLLVAAIAAGGAGLAANSWLAAQRAALASAQRVQPPVESNEVRVLVAKTALPAGTLIKESQLRWQAWPSSGLSSVYMKEGDIEPESLEGTVVRFGIAIGEPISEARVVRPGDHGFLAAVLRPGFRAVTVPVNATTGLAGFVLPGDSVDLILSHQLEQKGEDGRKLRASETVLTDIRVLAIDQSTNDQAEEASPVKTVTLEVKPKQVEMVSLVSDLGRLSLSLRGLREDEGQILQSAESVDPEEDGGETINPVLARLIDGETNVPERGKSHTLDSEVSRYLVSPKSKRNIRRVQVVRGGESAVMEFQR